MFHNSVSWNHLLFFFFFSLFSFFFVYSICIWTNIWNTFPGKKHSRNIIGLHWCIRNVPGSLTISWRRPKIKDHGICSWKYRLGCSSWISDRFYSLWFGRKNGTLFAGLLPHRRFDMYRNILFLTFRLHFSFYSFYLFIFFKTLHFLITFLLLLILPFVFFFQQVYRY